MGLKKWLNRRSSEERAGGELPESAAPIRFERLEPRLLLNADFLAADSPLLLDRPLDEQSILVELCPKNEDLQGQTSVTLQLEEPTDSDLVGQVQAQPDQVASADLCEDQSEDVFIDCLIRLGDGLIEVNSVEVKTDTLPQANLSETSQDMPTDSTVMSARSELVSPAEESQVSLVEVTGQGGTSQDNIVAWEYVSATDRFESSEDTGSEVCNAFGSANLSCTTEELVETLHAANPPPQGTAIMSADATDAAADLDPVIEEAIRQWSNLPMAEGFQTRLMQVKIEVADLPGGILAQTLGETILLDTSAAGYGWFIDPTPSDNSEFTPGANSGLWFADSTSTAYGRIDLLSVITHELGHVLGFEDLDTLVDPAALMAGTLSLGQRRLIGDSVGTLLASSYTYGSITGANLTINGTTVDAEIPYGDLESIIASTSGEAAALTTFFTSAVVGGEVIFTGTVTIAGQSLPGDFVLRRESDQQVLGGAASVTASLMSADVGVQITGGSGGFVLTDGGTALSIEGTASFVDMPGLIMSDTLAVRINTLGESAPDSAAVPNPDGGTLTVTFDFDGDVNAFEGSPSIQILGSDSLPLIDINGSMSIADDGSGVLLFDIADLNLTIYAGQEGLYMEVFSVDAASGQFALAGSSFETPGFSLVEGSIDPSSTTGKCEIAGISFTQNSPDQKAYAVVGPFQMIGATPLLAVFSYYDRSLEVSVGAKVDNLKLAWEKGEGTDKKEYSFEIWFADFKVGLSTTISETTDLAEGDLTGTGLFSIFSATADVKIANILTGSAYNISAQYDPEGADDQELFRADYLDITIEPIKLQFQLCPYTDPVTGQVIPGLVVRKNGFQLGRGKAILKVVENGNDPDSSERMVGFTDPFIQITDLGFTAGEAFSFSGIVSVGAKAVRIGKKDSTFAAQGTAVNATLKFDENSLPSGFQFSASSLSIKLTSYIEISAAVFEFNPGATGSEELASFNDLAVALKLGGVEIAGSISAFRINGDGDFVADTGFGATFSIGPSQGAAATGGLKWPSWLPIKSASVGVEWPDFETNPANFRLLLSIEVDAYLGPIHLTGSITNAKIDIGLLVEGKFPLIGLTSGVIDASGKLGAADVSGSLIIGLICFDEYGIRIPDGDITTPVADSIFYGGIDAGLTIAGKGFHLRLGISEKGPLSAYVTIDMPIILEPNSGLTIDNFRGGITFNALPFPEIDTTTMDTVATSLRSPRFRPTGGLDVTQWKAQLEQQVINQVGGQFGYLFSITDNLTNIMKHVTAMNTEATIHDEMKDAFLNHGYPMSAGFASVTLLQADCAWIVSYQGADYLVERYIPQTGIDQMLNISRLEFWLTDIPPPDGTTVLDDLDSGILTDALQQLFSDAGVTLSDSATIEVKTEPEGGGWSGREWFVRDGGAEYLLRCKGPNPDGKYSLAVLGGTASSMDGFDLGVIKIEAGCTLYFQATSEKALRGEMDLAITTDGQILLSGKLVFADGKLTATAKLFADLRDIAEGSGQIYFLMDVPDTPRVLSIVGTLEFGFIDSDGNPITRGENETLEEFWVRVAALDPGPAFQIQLQGKGLLTAAGFLGITCEGNLTLTFSETRFELAFDVEISIEGIISAEGAVSGAGILVVDNSDTFQMWGAMHLNLDSDSLEELEYIGISFEADVYLKINFGGPARDIILELPEREPEDLHLPANSFALFTYGDATFCPPPGGIFSLEMTGAFSLELNQTGLRMFLLANLRFEVLGTELMEFEALGLMAIVITYDDNGHVNGGGFAARLELARRLDIPGLAFEVEFQLYINTLGEEVVYELPAEFAEKLGETLPEDLAARIEGGQISIPAGAPRLAGLFLVGVEDGDIAALNAGSIPDGPNGLENKFQDNGCKLMNSSPTVTVLEMGSAWLVTDEVTNGGETYLARYLIEKTEGGTGLIITSQMFVIDSTTETVTALDLGTIPTSITQLFSDANLELVNASLSVVEAGAAWLITSGASGTNRYLLEKHGGKLLVMEPRAGPPGFYFVIAGGGSLTLLETFTLEGRFKIEASTTGLKLEVYAGLELGPLGHLRAAGVLNITIYDSDPDTPVVYKVGLVAALELELEAGLPLGPGVGIGIQGEFALAINTTNAPVPVNVPTSGGGTKSITLLAGSVLVHVEGSIDFLGFAQASGWADIFLSDDQFTLDADLNFKIGPLEFSASAEIQVDNTGIYFEAAVSLDLDILSLFDFDLDGNVIIDTRAGYFHLDLSGKVSILRVINLNGEMTIDVDKGAWTVDADLSGSFLHVVEMSASVFLNSEGEFDLDLHGSVQFGPAGFNIHGSVALLVKYLDNNGRALGGNGTKTLDISGSVNGGVTIFWIPLEISVGVSYNSTSGDISVSVGPVYVPRWGIPPWTAKYFTFVIANLKVVAPPPIVLGQVDGSGVLTLNVGPDAGGRNLAVDQIDEVVVIEYVSGGSTRGEKVTITMFGHSETFDNVLRIFIRDMAEGDDSVDIANGVGVPVEVHFGNGADRLNSAGSGVVTAYGDGGDDTLVGGSAQDWIEGGDDDDILIGNEGADTIRGGGGDDQIAGDLVNLTPVDVEKHDSYVFFLETIGSALGGDDDIEGGDGADVIFGGSGDDDIRGDAGDDILDAGDDILIGDDGTVTISAAQGLTITVSVLDFSGNDTIYGGIGADRIDGCNGADRVYGDVGNDTVTVLTASEGMVVDTGDDNDTINVRTISAALTINAGSGADTINVGSLAPAAGGTVNGIGAPLMVNGGADVDSLNVDDTGNSAAASGTLTSTTLTLTSMPGSIIYSSDVENLTVSLGSGGDSFTIQTTHVGTTTLNTGSGMDVVTVDTISGVTEINGEAGNDLVHVRTIGAATTVNGGAGNDTVNVGTLAPATGGNVNSISALLTVNGNEDSDTLNMDDTSDTAGNIGTLTSTQLTGLGMSDGITYGTLEDLNINLGSGGDTFTIEGAHTGATTVNTAAGRDTINVWNDSNCLDDIDGVLTVNAAEPADFEAGDLLDIRDTGNGTGRTGTLTDSTLSGLGMSGSIVYSGIEDLDLTLGTGPDTLRIKSISAVTTVNSGAGDDQINVWSDDNQLNGIVKLLTIDAGDPSASDSLTISDAGNSEAATGTLTSSTFSLSSMPSSIVYSNVEHLTISLGSGGNNFTIQTTHVGTTTLNTGGGKDVVTVETISGVTTINGQDDDDEIDVRTIGAATTVNGGLGNDTVNVGTLAPSTGGNVNSVSALLTVNGDGESDTLNVDDTADTDPNTGTLTSTQLTGLGMSHGITYGTLEDLNINLGSGGDTFHILSTHTGTTTVATAAGDDTINVGSLAPTITGGTLNDLAGLLIIQAGDGTDDILNVDDSGDETDNAGEMTARSITGLGMMGDGIEYEGLETLNLWLGQGSDTFTAHSTHNQLTNLYGGDGNDIITLEDASGMTNIYGGDGNDEITVDTLSSLATAVTGDTVNLDGEAGSDAYTVNVTGSGDYLVNVLDTGTGGSDEDTLTVNGTAGADNFLLRASEHEYPAGIAFVAALHGDPVDDVERINYNKAIEQLTANGGGEADHFTIDDNWALTTITGGEGADTFQVGQIFKSQRDAANANIAGEDEFATTLTTRGYLSNGVSYETTIEGDSGNDEFVVFRNLAELRLFGGADNDIFTIRAFALEGSHTTQLTGEGGSDYVEYVINAPVEVMGGDGTDTFKVIGTEFSDQIVITATGVFGMGVDVSYDEIEKLEVDGAEGNDTFYVLSTGEGVEIWLYGGLGSDRFSIAGDVPQIMSGSTEIYPETAGSHTVDVIQGPLHIEGMAGQGSTGGLGTPVMLPGETNTMASTGDVLVFEGEGTAASIDYMTVLTEALTAVESDLSNLIGKTIEISDGPGVGRFWQIEGFADGEDDGTTVLTLKSPAMPASEWGLPDGTSEFSITHLAANFFVTEEEQVDFATIYNDAETVGQSGVLTATTLTGFDMGAGGITYGDLEVLDIFLGSGADTLSITGAMQRDDGFQTVTMVNTGAGNDDVTVSLETGGLFALNTEAGDDHIHAATSTLPLIIFGGEGDDLIKSGKGDDVIFGDRGRIDYRDANDTLITRLGLGLTERYVLQPGETEDTLDDVPFKQTDGVARSPVLVTTRDAAIGGIDTIDGNDGGDIIFGGTAGDIIHAGAGNDLVFGDFGRVEGDVDATLLPLELDVHPFTFTSIDETSTYGEADWIDGEAGEDIILGQQGADTIYGGQDDDDIIGGHNVAGGYDTGDFIDGGAGNDVIAGDNAVILRGADFIYPRFRILSGTTIYDGSGNVLVTSDSQADPQGTSGRDITILNHSSTTDPNFFGDDYIAGGADNDMIFGQLGNDTIQGDGSIDLALTGGQPVSAYRDGNNELQVNPSFEAASDGADYIEGNGDNDLIFGNLGQDDIIGGSSSLFSLITSDLRPDGSDLIFGGAGTDIARKDKDEGDGLHGRDSDMILGDNGNIYRIVGTDGFNYDDDYDEAIVVRAAELLDYTPGGTDYNTAANSDIGAADEIHGESGDDFIYGMAGSDILFGDGQDDDLIGGYGNDWISGGTGQDGVIGDDGRIFTSRNGMTEPLNGVMVANEQDFISTPGNVQEADINVAWQLKKAVDLMPFSQEQSWDATADEWGGESKCTSDDVIYGGLGSDFLHGGSGDDAISGAEALPVFFEAPINSGNMLEYTPTTGEFAAYNEYDPLAGIDGFLLNFNASEGTPVSDSTYGVVNTDGDDKIFGDLGNDWLVGGTGNDNLYGGWGNDLLSADDDHGTNGGLNDQPDTHPSYADRAYGGAGRDVLIGNTGGDRLIDWVGEFNSYIIPFSAYGVGTVSRALQPQIHKFLYALSASDGSDLSRTADTGTADLARNGEPFGEIGLVRQQDFAWQGQTGAPDDPQAGNIPGGPRDVLRSANFDDGSTSGFFADSGSWTATGGVLRVEAASKGSDAVSVFHIEDALPGYFEIQASITVVKPTGGWEANGYIIFDYQGAQDFKFAGLDVSINKLVMGHRDATGWYVDEQAVIPGGVKAGWAYNLLLAVNGVTATLVMNRTNVFTHTYIPRVVDGYSYGLNWGMVGVGSDNSRGTFDNIRVQVLPPQVTFDSTEDFSDGVADLFTGDSSGIWTVSDKRYHVNPDGMTGMSLIDLGLDSLNVSSYLEMNAKINTQGRAGFIFDRYCDTSFKFAIIDALANQIIIGHYTAKSGWVSDAVVSKVIDAGTDYTLGVVLKGSTVSVTLNGQTVLGHAFNAAVVDGGFGLLATGGQASFDDVRIKTDDPAFRVQTLLASNEPEASVAGGGTTLTIEYLQTILDAAIERMGSAYTLNAGQLTMLESVNIQIADLGGQILGDTNGTTIRIDTDAAGYGWFVDSTPLDDTEFSGQNGGDLLAAAGSEAFGDMDLLTVVMHELGHVLGFADLSSGMNSADLMFETLSAGVRRAETRLLMETGTTFESGVWHSGGVSKEGHFLFDDWPNPWLGQYRLLGR